MRRNLLSDFARKLPLALAMGAALQVPMSAAQADDTATPIKHVVVIFQENVSFDHYFATYPLAANPAGEPKFVAMHGTPTVNGLTQYLREHTPTPPSLSVWTARRL